MQWGFVLLFPGLPLKGSGVFRVLGRVGEGVWSGFGRLADISLDLGKLLLMFFLVFGAVLVVLSG